jgi:hypothetical protein
MIEEVSVTFFTECDKLQAAVSWGGEIMPFWAPVQNHPQSSEGFLAPTEFNDKFSYLMSHPDVKLTWVETIPEDVRDFVCSARKSASL